MDRVIESLKESGLHREVAEALEPLCAAYPECPMSFLAEPSGDVEKGATYLKGLLPVLFDRWDEPATFVQVHAVYMAFSQGRLFVNSGISLANFPAVREYPTTEEARRIASSCRATVNVFFGEVDPETDDSWADYFWNRGLVLEPCSPIGLRERDHES
jgi:hypothetical protein